MVRSTHEGKRMMNSFLLKLVEENRNNDQAFLNHHLGHVQYSNDCQYNYTQSYDENIRRNNTDQQLKSQSSQNSSMCYLTDVLFQNGYLLYNCAAHKRAKTVSYTVIILPFQPFSLFYISFLTMLNLSNITFFKCTLISIFHVSCSSHF